MAIDFICGYECRILAAGAAPAPDERHWDAVTGAPTISTTTVRSGTAAMRSNPTATTGYLSKIIARTVVAGRVYVQAATLPLAGDGSVAIVANVNASGNLSVLVNSAGSVVVRAGSGTAQALGTISTGIWYRVDWLADSSGGTASIKGRLDGGTEETSTNVQASVNMTAVRTGFHSAATGDVFFDDLMTGDSSGDYPFGAGTVERMKPTRDGTHSFTAGDFRYNAAGANILTSATDVNTYVDDDDMSGITDFIAQRVIRSTGYVEVGFNTAPFTHDALAIIVVSSWHASTTGANTVGMKMNDGGTLANMLDAAGDGLSDFSNTTFTQSEKLVLTPPSGGTWTKAKIDALLMRMGYSTDVIGEPYWDGVMLEVAYGPAPPAAQIPYLNQMPPLIAQ